VLTDELDSVNVTAGIELPVAAKQRVALLDWDGTLHSGVVIVAWTKYLNEFGLMSDESAETVAKAYADLDEGRTDYLSMVDRVTAGYAHGLVGRGVREVSALAEGFADSQRDQFTWFAPELISELRAADVETVVITGSPTVAVRPLASLLGIDRVIGLKPFAFSGMLTSMLPQNTARPEVKRHIVEAFDGEVVLAAGNSVSDEPLLAAALVRLFVGDGQPPSLPEITRIPQTESAQARKVLATAIANAKNAEIAPHAGPKTIPSLNG